MRVLCSPSAAKASRLRATACCRIETQSSRPPPAPNRRVGCSALRRPYRKTRDSLCLSFVFFWPAVSFPADVIGESRVSQGNSAGRSKAEPKSVLSASGSQKPPASVGWKVGTEWKAASAGDSKTQHGQALSADGRVRAPKKTAGERGSALRKDDLRSSMDSVRVAARCVCSCVCRALLTGRTGRRRRSLQARRALRRRARTPPPRRVGCPAPRRSRSFVRRRRSRLQPCPTWRLRSPRRRPGGRPGLRGKRPQLAAARGRLRRLSSSSRRNRWTPTKKRSCRTSWNGRSRCVR